MDTTPVAPTRQEAKQFLTLRANEFLHKRAGSVSRKLRRTAARRMAKHFYKDFFKTGAMPGEVNVTEA